MKTDYTNPLAMSEEEICRDFRTAKDKLKQVGILADLNMTSRARIVDVLLGNGVEVNRSVIKVYGSKEAKQRLRTFELTEPESPEPETAAPAAEEPAAAPEPETAAPAAITVGMLLDILSAFPEDAPILCAGEGVALVRVCQERIYGTDYVRQRGPETTVTLWAGDPQS